MNLWRIKLLLILKNNYLILFKILKLVINIIILYRLYF